MMMKGVTTTAYMGVRTELVDEKAYRKPKNDDKLLHDRAWRDSSSPGLLRSRSITVVTSLFSERKLAYESVALFAISSS